MDTSSYITEILPHCLQMVGEANEIKYVKINKLGLTQRTLYPILEIYMLYKSTWKIYKNWLCSRPLSKSS